MSFFTGSAADLLLSRGLLTSEDLVEGVEIRCAAGRNGGLQVEKADGSGFFVKWAQTRTGAAVEVEGAFYQACGDAPELAALACFLPRLKRVSSVGPMLVTELVGGAKSFFDTARSGDARTFAGQARALGQALGGLHRLGRRRLVGELLPGLPSGRPWPFELGRPSLDLRPYLHPAQEKLLQILQSQAELLYAIDAQATRWSSSTLIHGDLREANLLVGREGELRLIDWELLQWGDPAWDLGAVFEAHLDLWLRAMPLDPEATAERRASLGGISWTVLGKGLRSFWTSYRRFAGVGRVDPVAASLLERSVAFSAVHLLRAAWEQSAAGYRLTTLAVLFLQIAANILADVGRATDELYELGS